MQFESGRIEDVQWIPLKKYADERGWLCEMFRKDDVEKLGPDLFPIMGYVSKTYPGIPRGPHEHKDQTDYFCFIGPSNFKVYVWDNRPKSPSYRKREVKVVGEDNPMIVIIPPGVVHAYRNVGDQSGLVFNYANRLFKGWDRKEEVDEIRHEDKKDSPFQLD